MISIPTVTDVLSISQREALLAQRKIVGITVSQPAYVEVPDATDPDAVWEYVIDVRLLDGITQAIVSDNAGTQTITNVPIIHEAVGTLLGDFNTPVEMELSSSGQLTIIGRAKIHLSDLRRDTYSYFDLNMIHLYEYTKIGAIYFDPFLNPATVATGRTSFDFIIGARLSDLGELVEDDDGNTILLGVNPLQRIINTNTKVNLLP